MSMLFMTGCVFQAAKAAQMRSAPLKSRNLVESPPLCDPAPDALRHGLIKAPQVRTKGIVDRRTLPFHQSHMINFDMSPWHCLLVFVSCLRDHQGVWPSVKSPYIANHRLLLSLIASRQLRSSAEHTSTARVQSR